MRIADIVDQFQRVLVTGDNAFDGKPRNMRDKSCPRRATGDAKTCDDDAEEHRAERDDTPEAQLTP
jgi:hypothetical protein